MSKFDPKLNLGHAAIVARRRPRLVVSNTRFFGPVPPQEAGAILDKIDEEPHLIRDILCAFLSDEADSREAWYRIERLLEVTSEQIQNAEIEEGKVALAEAESDETPSGDSGVA